MAGGRKTCGYSDQVPDTQAPVCEVNTINPGPPLSVSFSVRDNESGIKEIQLVQNQNATISIPPFVEGAKGPLTVTAAETNPSGQLKVEMTVTDMAGNFKTCGYTETTTIDTTPPRCEITSQDPGPPGIIKVILQDQESGIARIQVLEAINATVAVPQFATGTIAPLTVTITQVIAELDFNVKIETSDVQANVATCNYSSKAFQASRPEFDAVGKDSANLFSDFLMNLIGEKGKNGLGTRINDYSQFTSEYFINTSGGLTTDPCFSTQGKPYMSAFTPSYTEGSYEWQVTLQMKPSTDIHLQLVGCIIRIGENDVWKHARQTGLYRVPWDLTQAYFAPTANPRIIVKALPGINAKVGFPPDGFYLDARKTPGLEVTPLANTSISLGAFIETGILAVLPRTGIANSYGQSMCELNAGDRIRVTLIVPFNSTADIYLGNDNLILKYTGIVGTEFVSQ
jgi:hypothetical protein